MERVITGVRLWTMSLEGAGVSYLMPAAASSSANGNSTGPENAFDGDRQRTGLQIRFRQ